MIETKQREPKFKALAFGLVVAFMAGCLLLVAKPAHADTFTVNSTGDTGDLLPGNGRCFTGGGTALVPECTLRAAMEENNANDNGATVVDAIGFNIGGGGVKTIHPISGPSWPKITEPVIIDGFSQPGASKNTKAVGNNAILRIRLDGGAAPFGLTIEANNSVVQGLSITRFAFSALRISGADSTKIEGNFIGTDPSGTQKGQGSGIGVDIGDDESGTQSAFNNIVGGTSPGARNIISGNDMGVAIFLGAGNKVMGNYIGTTKDGTGNLGNLDEGVRISESSGNTIGDDDPSDGLTNAANIIAFNGGPGGISQTTEAGVGIFGDMATGNRVLSNSIFSNGELGIDLGAEGFTPNDAGDPDAGPNNLQNYPLITSAKTGRRATIKCTLDSTSNATFTIQYFSNPKGTRDEGKTFIGETTVTDSDSDGIIIFTFKSARKVKPGLFVTATVTEDSTGDTSEFSAPKKVRG